MSKIQISPKSLLRDARLYRRLIPAAVLPHLFMMAAGCAGIEDPDFDGDQPEAGDSKGAVASVPTVFAYDPAKRGMVQAALVAAGAEFAADDFRSVIINVDGSDARTLLPVITGFLDDGKEVVLDSGGGAAERAAIASLTGEIAGIAPEETALTIVKQGPGAYTVTPIVTGGASLGPDDADAGNTPLAVLLRNDLVAPPTFSVTGTTAAATDTITKSSYKGHGQPTPPIIPSYVDNKATHLWKTWANTTTLKRYLFRGNPQRCPTGGTNSCTMSWGESYAKAVANATSISVNFTNKLTEKLTGGVTLGYSLTITNTKTLTWSNGVNIKPGWTARPVSYLWRRSGRGDVKNAYVFSSRRKVFAPCRPTLDCYRYTDTYVRQPNTVVGAWLANVALNQGAPTNSWNTFNSNLDPNSYVFD